MEITILGSGTSTGVPLLHCSCKVCQSTDPKNKRLRASAWVQVNGKNFLIDTSTDLRQQALANQIPRIDAVLYTHPHADHIHGIDELRSFNFLQKQPIPTYGNAWTCQELRERFPYIFSAKEVTEGGGIPQILLNKIPNDCQQMDIQGVPVEFLWVKHGSKDCLGYKFGKVAYITDCNTIPPATLDRMRGLSVLILDCLRLRLHSTHFNLEQALEVIEQVKPQQTYLTHLGHDFDHSEWVNRLPKPISLAYDGLKIFA